ncbi:MAG: hypothetical protein ACI4GY_07310 [Acutalibacteraceae bacterium]
MKGIVTGLGVGMAVGSAVSMAATVMSNSSVKRQYKKKAAKALKSMEHIFGDVQYMFK